MTSIRVWAISAAAVVALAAGALMAGGAVSFAQDGSTTPTPAPSTTAPDGSTTPMPYGGDNPNCPNMGTDGSSTPSSSSGTSTSRFSTHAHRGGTTATVSNSASGA